MLIQIFLFLVFVLRLYFCKYRKFAFYENDLPQNAMKNSCIKKEM